MKYLLLITLLIVSLKSFPQMSDEAKAVRSYGLIGKGNIKLKANEYIEAIKYYDSAIVFSPNYSEAFIKRARANEMLGNINKAIDDYNMAVEKSKSHLDYYERADFKLRNNDYYGAMKDVNTALEAAKFGMYYHCRGTIKYRLQDYKGAILDFKEATYDQLTKVEGFVGIGNCLLQLKDYKGAIVQYTNAINQETDLPENKPKAYYNRGLAKYNLGFKSEACKDFSKAGELGYNYAYEVIKTKCK